MPPPTPTFATDRQRLARASQHPKLLLASPANDKARLAQVASTRPVPKPLVVSKNTFVIRGKDDTYLGISFGYGRQVHQLNLYDHLPADRVPHLGNYVFDLTGIIPDAIGLDIGGAIGASAASGMAGINLIWHTRGEKANYPEVHVYYGGSGSLTAGAIFDSFLTMPNASASVQLILAWANHYDKNGKNSPSTNAWVANGFNWTGTFWSVGFSVPIPPRFTFVGSYFKSAPFFAYPVSERPADTDIWVGVSLGVGISGKFKITSPHFKLDVTKLLDFKKLDLSVNHSQTEYGLIYGNGNDFNSLRKDQDITGWHIFHPVNQNDYLRK